jgi:hypothetical protein
MSNLRLLGFPFCRLLDSQGLRWKYSYPPPHGVVVLHLLHFDREDGGYIFLRNMTYFHSDYTVLYSKRQKQCFILYPHD